jgi:hypothetical protein
MPIGESQSLPWQPKSHSAKLNAEKPVACSKISSDELPAQLPSIQMPHRSSRRIHADLRYHFPWVRGRSSGMIRLADLLVAGVCFGIWKIRDLRKIDAAEKLRSRNEAVRTS